MNRTDIIIYYIDTESTFDMNKINKNTHTFTQFSKWGRCINNISLYIQPKPHTNPNTKLPAFLQKKKKKNFMYFIFMAFLQMRMSSFFVRFTSGYKFAPKV